MPVSPMASDPANLPAKRTRSASLSDTIKRQLRATRLSPERRLARACLEMLRPKNATSLVALQSLQQKVAFLIGDDEDDDDDDYV